MLTNAKGEDKKMNLNPSSGPNDTLRTTPAAEYFE